VGQPFERADRHVEFAAGESLHAERSQHHRMRRQLSVQIAQALEGFGVAVECGQQVGFGLRRVGSFRRRGQRGR
jgi:hypothetical protein